MGSSQEIFLKGLKQIQDKKHRYYFDAFDLVEFEKELQYKRKLFNT